MLMGDRTNSSREEHLVLKFSTNFLAIDDVVIESKQRDIPIREVLLIWERPPFGLGRKLILRHLLVLRNPALLQSIEMLKIPVQ